MALTEIGDGDLPISERLEQILDELPIEMRTTRNFLVEITTREEPGNGINFGGFKDAAIAAVIELEERIVALEARTNK